MALTDILALESVTGTELFAIDASGNVTVVGTLSVAGVLTFTGGTVHPDDIQAIFGVAGGTDATIAWISATDDLLLDVANAVGIGRLKTGTDTTATQWQIEDDTGNLLASFNGAGGITIGGDTGTEACNLFTGASAKAITIGHAASASMDLEAGVGAFTAQGDSTAAFTFATSTQFVTPTFDLDGTLDLDAALTATGDFANIAGTINHATNDAEGVDVSITQLTTPRTAGSVVGVQVSATSLAGDSGGSYVGFRSVLVDGGGSATHIGFQIGAGHDVLMDISLAATGEADVLMAANLVEAMSWSDSVGTVMAITTATGAVGLDLDGLLDLDYTSTVAAEFAGVAGVINNATANAIGVAASVAQASTNRTAGTVTGVRAAVTSLAGDTAGVDYYAYEAAVTVGEATADHFAFKVGAGFDTTIDASSTATTEAGVVLGANLVDAWSMFDSTGDLMVLGTATGAFTADLLARVTTTDGVASGTAKVVGGRANASVADSSEIVQAAGGQVAFDETYSIPASTLKAGSTLHIRAVVRISTVLNGGATMDSTLRLGGAAIITSHESTAGAAGTRLVYEAWLTFRGAPGAAVEAAGVTTAVWSDTLGSITTAPLAAGAVPTFATNGALVVDATGESSAAGDASGRIVLEQLLVNIT